MLYILYGQDDFSIKQELNAIIKNLGNAEMLGINTSVLDGLLIDIQQLQNVCNTIPFLHTVRLVIVNGLLGRFESKSASLKNSDQLKDKTSSDFKEWLVLKDYIIKFPETTVLIFVDGRLTVRNPLLKQIISIAVVKNFPMLKGYDLISWIKQRAKQEGSTITANAINVLIDLLGSDLWRLSTEIDKLVAYVSGKTINDIDVKTITSYSRETNIFSLVDAILEGRQSMAYQSLHKLFQDGASPAYILTMITRQLRFLIRSKELIHRVSSLQIKTKLGIKSDYELNKIMKQVESYSMEQLKAAYKSVLDVDIIIKTGTYDGDLAINLFVMELCHS